MKNIFSAFILTLLCLIFFSVLYPLAVTGIAQFAPNKGRGEIILLNAQKVGFQKVGQSFRDEKYFWGRPSAVNYNAAGSGGSNKGTSNPDYLKEVQTRVDTFLVYHPYLKSKDIPSELVTASGSGLDPHISPKAALIQVKRIAKVRKLDEQILKRLVQTHTKSPLLGFLGTSTVNVLELNMDLNKLK